MTKFSTVFKNVHWAINIYHHIVYANSLGEDFIRKKLKNANYTQYTPQVWHHAFKKLAYLPNFHMLENLGARHMTFFNRAVETNRLLKPNQRTLITGLINTRSL